MWKYFKIQVDKPPEPYDNKELLKFVTQAKENSLNLKYTGGTFPVSRDSSDVLIISLKSIRRLLSYDPLTNTITVEPGLSLKELTTSMEYLNYTLELYGTIPNMSVADAINVGLIGSNGTISQCLKNCQVICADTTILEWTWPLLEQIPDLKARITKDLLYMPTLQTLVCGLGVVGIINKCTLTCVPMKLAQENIYETNMDNVIEKLKTLSESMYVNLNFFPLLDKVIVTKADVVRLRNAQVQPLWKKYIEYCCWSFHWLVHYISPFLSCYVTSSALFISNLQFLLMKFATTFRREYTYKPQSFTSVGAYCRGTKWVLPMSNFRSTVNSITDWSKRYPHICTTPLFICVQTHHDFPRYQPFLCPYSDRETFTVWSDWFRSSSISSEYSVSMAEYESVLQENGGRKCWSAGPVYASPLIGQMYPGFRHFCGTKLILDPKTIFRSSYVEGDIFGENY